MVRTVRYNTCDGKRTTPIAFQGKCQGQLWPPCEGMPHLALSSIRILQQCITSRWPLNAELVTLHFKHVLIPNGDTDKLIEQTENLLPTFVENATGFYDQVNSLMAETDPFNDKMFEAYNRAALEHYPDNEV